MSISYLVNALTNIQIAWKIKKIKIFKLGLCHDNFKTRQTMLRKRSCVFI